MTVSGSYLSDRGLWVGARAHVLEDDGRLKAWAEKHVRRDRDITWILGNFVEAERANSNGHIFPLADLQGYSVATIPYKPLNMLHHEKYIVGAFAGAELLEPAPQAQEGGHPVVEALSGMWSHVYPDETAIVKKAHAEGALFYSMEALPESLTCPDCTGTYPFKGLQHESYCAHLNASRISAKVLNKPHFNGGACIIPPVKPGWSNADITDLSALLKEHADQAEAVYASFQDQAPHLSAKEWESLMLQVMLMARDFSQGDRKKSADEGSAMPDGSFPIKNAEDLKNAIRLAGNAKDPAAAKAHIIKRAKALGLENMIPDTWK